MYKSLKIDNEVKQLTTNMNIKISIFSFLMKSIETTERKFAINLANNRSTDHPTAQTSG